MDANKKKCATPPVSEEQIALIVELALRQHLPPTFIEALMAKIHTLSAEEGMLVTTSLMDLERTNQDVAQKSMEWLFFWDQLAVRIEQRLTKEARIIEQQIFEQLITANATSLGKNAL